jgi:(3S)-malyl-CoA thioesterase|tara:strand:+ start:8303 stop:9235 length:933 start_codon:yes stop_codon:yes gene_type:complete
MGLVVFDKPWPIRGAKKRLGQPMQQLVRPFRSVLYIPASKERVLEKAMTLTADALIFDLEDAVSPDAKAGARAIMRAALLNGNFGARYKIVRINGFDTPWGRDDVDALSGVGADAILLPKVNTPRDIDNIGALIDKDMPIWAMMETAQGVLNAAQIAAHPRLQGIVAGTNDLIHELGCSVENARFALQTSLQLIILAARAHGVVAIDGVYNRFKDEAGLRAECQQGLALGFDGKSLIHPAQLDVANDVFAPSEAAISLAQRQIAAYDDIIRAGQGVAVVDGKIVENLHADTARRVLRKAQMIEELEATGS